MLLRNSMNKDKLMDIVNQNGEQSLKGFCDHCGNITFQNLLHLEVTQVDNETETYTFCKCTICSNLLLRKHPGDWNTPLRSGERPKPNDIEFDQLWPPQLTLPSEAPSRVRQIYEEARVIKQHSPSSFVVQIGRALEAVTKDKDAEGRTLYQKLNWLVESGELPKIFGEMGQINRIIRNWGAHDAEISVEADDVEVVDEFFKAIIEYLYVAPAKVNRVSKLLDERKNL